MGREHVTVVCGIDPGLSGGIAISRNGKVEAYKTPETERDIFDLLDSFSWDEPVVFLEAVHSFPGQGVTSSFTFGRGYGFLRGIITALKYPLYDVRPQVWMKELSCMTKGNKNISKQKAQQLFPELKITHATADCLLIMEFGRRWMENQGRNKSSKGENQ